MHTSANLPMTANAVWFLVGMSDSVETVRCLPIHTMPYLIGRRQDLGLSLDCKTVSNVHAEITQSGDSLVLRDLGSTNGTYLNGRRLTEPAPLSEEDLVQFANMAFRLRRQNASVHQHTVQENACDRALALVQFDKLMTQRAVTPHFQPIVAMASREIVSYEVLARSRLFGLEMPAEMFRVAAQLKLEVELSTMLRWEGVQASLALAGPPHLFLNTHPQEISGETLVTSLENLRETHPDQPLTLEIHESAVADAARMAEIRDALKELRIGLAYDDFGVGQSRLSELVETAPDCVKFDISLVHDIDASPQRQQMLTTLVQMVRDLGIATLAEGVETEAEHDICLRMGFDLGQGFLYGRPAATRASWRNG